MKFSNYLDIRDSIQTGDIFFTSGNSILSFLIKLITRSSISHVGMFIVVEGRVFAVESIQWKGCVISLASRRFKYSKLVVCRPLKRVSIARILGDVDRIKYNYIGVLLAPFIASNSAQKYCAEWVAKQLRVKVYKKRGIYPVDLYNKFVV